MKKNIAFFAKNLDIGGIERAIINYVNNIDYSKYNVTLFLEKKEGIYLSEINKNININNFNINENKNIIIRKFINALKLIKFSIKYNNRFDFAANFATSLKSGAILSKRFSKNNAIWFHGNYWNTKEEAQKFLKYVRAKKYRKIVFVSESLKDKYLSVYNSNQLLYVINNPVNYNEMLRKGNEIIKEKKTKTLILNVGRHEEKSKNLIMLLNSVKKLLDANYDFELWMVGSGPDTDLYKAKVKDLNIEKNVKFLGKKSNVYPYFKICDASVLSSYEEGNPVVYLESKIFNKPIISTDVSDSKIELKGYGIITDINEESFIKGLKKFLDEGYKIKSKFDPEKYNNDVFNKLYQVIED